MTHYGDKIVNVPFPVFYGLSYTLINIQGRYYVNLVLFRLFDMLKDAEYRYWISEEIFELKFYIFTYENI